MRAVLLALAAALTITCSGPSPETSLPAPADLAYPTGAPRPTPPKPTATPAINQRSTPAPTRAPRQGSGRLNSFTDLRNAAWLEHAHPETARTIAALPWIADGLTEREERTLEQLLYALARKHSEETVSLLGMPFLKDHGPGDLQALREINILLQDNSDAPGRLLEHPGLTGGITNRQTPLIAALGAVRKRNPELADILPGLGEAQMESRSVSLPLAGTVELRVIRTGPVRSREAMDLLERAVRGAERFMGEPFPTDMAVLLFADTAAPGFAGANYGAAIVITPETEGKEKALPGVTAHEVAHYYWNSDEKWVNEGMADFITEFLESAEEGRRMHPRKPPCFRYGSIKEMPPSDTSRLCDYALGHRLFIDLHDTAGSKCSELRGSEQLAACGEGIQSSGAPGTEEGSESHLGVGALG